MQVMAAAHGREHLRLAPEEAVATVAQQQAAASGMGALLAWPGCLRRLDRLSPGYDA
jgi:hypothetical protein